MNTKQANLEYLFIQANQLAEQLNRHIPLSRNRSTNFSNITIGTLERSTVSLPLGSSNGPQLCNQFGIPCDQYGNPFK
jgi:hypothetical protein